MAKAIEINNGNGFEMGEPYFCTECNRNHTKGKIYKEHLEFARINDSEEKDSNDKSENINDENDDEEFKRFLFLKK